MSDENSGNRTITGDYMEVGITVSHRIHSYLHQNRGYITNIKKKIALENLKKKVIQKDGQFFFSKICSTQIV